jgi:hypothetical protein
MRRWTEPGLRWGAQEGHPQVAQKEKVHVMCPAPLCGRQKKFWRFLRAAPSPRPHNVKRFAR